MQIWPTKKIVSFPVPTQSPPAPGKCEICGNSVHGGSMCRNCGLRLIDLALSSVADVDLEVVQPPSKDDDAPTPVARMRYAHYELCQRADGSPWELGRGGMGITYQARDVYLGSLVALKIIAPGRLDGTRFTDRFLLEARTAAQLRHPNIASIHHLGLQEDACFYAMEYIQGESLEECIQSHGALSPAAALNIALQCARGLSTAHGQGFVHRDLKPSNIMLMSTFHGADLDESTVKLIDFGLAKALLEEDSVSDNICHGYFAGTPHYASPEHLAGRRVDARSDIYSLGMCLWFMLVGKVSAFSTTGDGRQVYPRSWTSLTAELVKQVPTPVFTLVESMISPEPGGRPQSALELIQAIQACSAMMSKRQSNFRWIVLPVAVVAITAATFAARSYATNNRTSPAAMPNATQAEARALCAEGDEHRSRLTKEDNLQAIDLYERAIARWPEFADAHAGLAMAIYQSAARFGEPSQRFDVAADHAGRAIAFDSTSPRGYHALAAIHTVQGHPWEALGQLHRALEIDARYLPAMRDFSLVWSWVGQPQMGLAWALTAAKLEPNNVCVWYAAAEASAELGADEQAVMYYRRCQEINPGWVDSYCGLIRLHILERNFAAARQDMQLAETIDAGSIYIQTMKAQSAFFAGENGEAEAVYRRLLKLNRSGLANYYGGISYLSALGYLRFHAGDTAEANSFLEEASALHLKDSEGPQAIYDLAAIRAIQGRKDDAMKLLERAVRSGWMDQRATRLDPRFESLREETRFQDLLSELGARAEQMRHESVRLCARPLSIADYPVQRPQN